MPGKILKAAARAVFRLLGTGTPRRRPPQLKRLAVIAGGWLGDTFWALQTLPELRELLPETEILAVVRPGARALLRGLLPDGQTVTTDAIVSDRTRERFRPGAFLATAHAVRRLRPDAVLDLMGNRYSALFCRLLGAYSAGLAAGDGSEALYSLAVPPDAVPGTHMALRPRAVVRRFLGLPDSAEFTLRPPQTADVATVRARENLDPEKPLALLVPGAGWPAKAWPAEKYRDAAEKLAARGWQLAVSVSEKEDALFAAVAGAIPGVRKITGVARAVDLIPLCRLCLGGDTGIMHIAESFGVPCVELYCQTNPALHRAPGAHVRCLCAPCPLAPKGDRKFCAEPPAPSCARAEFMDIGVEEALKTVED